MSIWAMLAMIEAIILWGIVTIDITIGNLVLKGIDNFLKVC